MNNQLNSVLIVAATAMEIEPFRAVLVQDFEQVSADIFKQDQLRVQVLVTGIGMLLTSVRMMQVLEHKHFDLVINAGVAGAFNRSLELGEVVEVERERFGDLGVQERDGSFVDVFEMGLFPKNELPFRQGELINTSNPLSLSLKKVKGLTVNKVHGEEQSIRRIEKKYQADIESMEGVGFFYVCLLKKIPCVQIRSISNYVEPRNRANWKMKLAIDNLNHALLNIFKIYDIFK